VFAACAHDTLGYAVVQSPPTDGWKRQQPLSFEVPVKDSLSLFRIDITSRFRNHYTSNLFLAVLQVTAPSGDQFCDTLSFPITHTYNRLWNDFKFPYCSHVQFAQKGTWRFTVWHCMEENELKGVSAIGLYIEKE